ncbi:DUF927 domain-containing protein [Lysinibacillus sp. NPDC092081]|uniref:phage NrS-1 polymerase family protein n=1 Tax=Lysinibacillus sp. NPDC092081 TaxID=3364131 RepID=UPI003820E903
MAILEKEQILLVAAENIPIELKQLKQWVLWKAEWDEKQKVFTKVPFRSNGRYKAYSNKPESWDTFDNIYEAYENGIGEGIGFVLSETDPYACIDIDEISNVHDLPELAQEIVNLSYAELSPSGQGIHIWIRCIHDKEKYMNKNVKLKYEIYDRKRLITFTGEALNDLPISEGKEIESFIEKIFKREKATHSLPQQPNGRGKAAFSESELIQIAEKSKTGSRFKVFINGGWEQLYSSQSEADLAFLNDLAFWTNCDYQMMDSIFRRSSLMRDKWDRKQNKTTYGDEQINKAIQECTNTFVPDQKVDLIPYGYQIKYGALYQISEKVLRDGSVEQKEQLICSQSPLIVRSFENVETDDLYYELNWKDEHRLRKAIVLASQIGSRKELVMLSNRSLAVTENNAKNMIDYFYSYLMHNKSNLTREHLVSRIGHIKGYFVHPLFSNEVMIKPNDLGEKQLLEAFQTSGTVKEWIENVLNPIQNHPKALLMVLASFASVLLKDLKLQPFVIDFAGETSNGKTTILRACASIWGTDTLMSEWNITKVAAERKTTFLNSFPLILDDSRKANEKTLGDFIYNFSGGRSKGRGSTTGSQQEFTWNNILISTGEASLTAYAEQKGGVAARIISIEGIPFENVKPSFFTSLHNGIDSYYGETGKQFVEKWQKHKKALLPQFSEYVEVCQKKAENNPVIVRVARNFAVLIFTGKLLNMFFKLDIDLMQLYRLFDELVSENKALDKPKQLLEMMLQDLQADRKSIFYEYEPSVEIKGLYKNNTLWITPKFLKDFLGIEEKTIRAAWLKRGYTQKFEHRGKEVDYKSITHKKIPFRAISLNNSIIAELGFDFSERKR